MNMQLHRNQNRRNNILAASAGTNSVVLTVQKNGVATTKVFNTPTRAHGTCTISVETKALLVDGLDTVLPSPRIVVWWENGTSDWYEYDHFVMVYKNSIDPLVVITDASCEVRRVAL